MKPSAYIFLFIKFVLAMTVAIVSASILWGMPPAKSSVVKGFCDGDSYSNGDRVSFRDLREMPQAATGDLTVDAGRNGGVKVIGSDRPDVLVRACVQTWGKTDAEAKAVAAGIKISSGSIVKAEGPEEEKWSVSYEVLVPRNTNLKLNAHNGGIAIGNVEGRLEFETQNGGVSLRDVAGDVRGRTTNGGVNLALSGASWKGSGLEVTTTNGGVKISMPENYAANIETGTVNGGFRSDIPALNVSTENIQGDEYSRPRSKRISTAFNGGGAPLKISTTNGGVSISSAQAEKKY
jgi:hypothetical protein